MTRIKGGPIRWKKRCNFCLFLKEKQRKEEQRKKVDPIKHVLVGAIVPLIPIRFCRFIAWWAISFHVNLPQGREEERFHKQAKEQDLVFPMSKGKVKIRERKGEKEREDKVQECASKQPAYSCFMLGVGVAHNSIESRLRQNIELKGTL